MPVPNPFLSRFVIHLRLESCVTLYWWRDCFKTLFCPSGNSLILNLRLWKAIQADTALIKDRQPSLQRNKNVVNVAQWHWGPSRHQLNNWRKHWALQKTKSALFHIDLWLRKAYMIGMRYWADLVKIRHGSGEGPEGQEEGQRPSLTLHTPVLNPQKNIQRKYSGKKTYTINSGLVAPAAPPPPRHTLLTKYGHQNNFFSDFLI